MKPAIPPRNAPIAAPFGPKTAPAIAPDLAPINAPADPPTALTIASSNSPPNHISTRAATAIPPGPIAFIPAPGLPGFTPRAPPADAGTAGLIPRRRPS